MSNSYVPVFRKPKRRGRRRQTTAAKVSRNTKAIAKMERDEEKKFIDNQAIEPLVYVGAAPIAPITVVNEIPQGIGANARDGARCTLEALSVKYWFAPASCIGTVAVCDTLTQRVRVIGVWFKGVGSANAADISLDNILQDTGDVLSHYKKNGKVTYDKIFDWTHDVEFAPAYEKSAAPSAAQWVPLANSSAYRTIYHKLGKQGVYRDSIAVEPVKGVLAIYAICETSSSFIPATVQPITHPLGAINMTTRLTFTDD